ncbi:GNAT family N-acetyltransferase [Marinitoga sp. 1155]|uniref:GNAT family N-acetyltransferase n=1 Tax=Marinitoga sp. 1155 TaxID=1428448 RepID=UPI000659AA3F|nr:GNAT family N-acetyltransferase [Marinitoga sp. 1155]KLO23685.1 hypothetical protein X274_05730 [Marinitoga sp. 1155]
MNIRKAKENDKKDLVEVTRYSWDDDYIPEVFDDWVKEKNGNFYVIEEKNKVIGCGRMKEIKPGIFWLEGLRVHKNFRNKGYARKLTEFFLKLAGEKGYKKVMFSTYFENVESRHIMENYGFVVFSKYKWLYFNEKKYNELSDENFKIAEDFEKIKNYIFNSIEYKYFNYISFAWTFIEFDVELLKYIFDRKEIFIKESEGEIETLVILSEYLQKNNTLSISFISGDIETALDFSIYQYLKKEKSYLNIMIPEELHIKNKFLNKGFLEEDNEKTNVLLYVLE